MTEKLGDISQNAINTKMHGGMQAVQGNFNKQIMESNVSLPSKKQLSQEDVIRMLARIEQMINEFPLLPESDREKSLRYLGAAKEEVQADEPDKKLAAGNLRRMTETIKTTNETVESTKTLWENVKPVLKELPGWFNVAQTFFGL
ncbi:MAG: hypothetical protein AAF316_16540 [Cyanobacteria bacterium P01_A01_bin.80]